MICLPVNASLMKSDLIDCVIRSDDSRPVSVALGAELIRPQLNFHLTLRRCQYIRFAIAQQGKKRSVGGRIDFALSQLCVTIELKDKQREALVLVLQKRDIFVSLPTT